MEGGSAAAEAERWLTIAAKLLAARDMHGARTFAIRARESDPRYEGSSQVLAVSDTLMAGDSLVYNHPDWYSVLQVARFTSDLDLIARQYRNLVLLLNPVRSRLAFADQALKLVYEAWSVLSNPATKLLYDNELHLSNLGQNQNQPPLTPNHLQSHPLSQPPATPIHHRPIPTPTPATPIYHRPIPTPTPERRSPRTNDGAAAAEEEEPSLAESTRAPDPEPRHNPAPPEPNRTAEVEPEPEPELGSEVASFWTACPYCYYLYEYPKVYEECTLRCQNCRRAFHAAAIPTPPLSGGKNPNFCSWGFFPLGISGNAKPAANWCPISPMFTCPLQGGGEPAATNPAFPEVRKARGRPRRNPIAPPRPRAYDYDPDLVIDLSDPSDDSKDGEWKSGSSKKANRGPVGRPPRKAVVPQAEVVVVHALSAQVARSGKKQSAVPAKDLGKLDLNVEFSNDLDGHRGEDNMEGNGFFEGLDEFLSSLPILNVVKDEKVKAS